MPLLLVHMIGSYFNPRTFGDLFCFQYWTCRNLSVDKIFSKHRNMQNPNAKLKDVNKFKHQIVNKPQGKQPS